MRYLDQSCFELVAASVGLVKVIVAEALVRFDSLRSLAPVIDS